MNYKQALSLTRQAKAVSQDYLDTQMEKAREVSIDARRKLLTAKQQERVEHQQKILELKTSLYGF